MAEKYTGKDLQIWNKQTQTIIESIKNQNSFPGMYFDTFKKQSLALLHKGEMISTGMFSASQYNPFFWSNHTRTISDEASNVLTILEWALKKNSIQKLNGKEVAEFIFKNFSADNLGLTEHAYREKTSKLQKRLLERENRASSSTAVIIPATSEPKKTSAIPFIKKDALSAIDSPLPLFLHPDSFIKSHKEKMTLDDINHISEIYLKSIISTLTIGSLPEKTIKKLKHDIENYLLLSCRLDKEAKIKKQSLLTRFSNANITSEPKDYCRTQLHETILKIKNTQYNHTYELIKSNPAFLNAILEQIGLSEDLHLYINELNKLKSKERDPLLKDLSIFVANRVFLSKYYTQENMPETATVSERDLENNQFKDKLLSELERLKLLSKLLAQYETSSSKEILKNENFITSVVEQLRMLGIDFKLGDAATRERIEAFSRKNESNIREIAIFSIKIQLLQTESEIIDELMQLPQSTSSSHDNLRRRKNEIEGTEKGDTSIRRTNVESDLSLPELIQQREAISKTINRDLVHLIGELIKIPNQDNLESIYAVFGLDPKTISSHDITSIDSTLATRLGQFLFGSAGMDRLEAVYSTGSTYLNSARTGAIAGTAVGIATAPFFGPLSAGAGLAVGTAATAADLVVRSAVESITRTAYGEFNQKYAKNNFTPSENFKTAFGDKSDIVNTFYWNMLLDIDLKLSIMSDLELRSENAIKLSKMKKSLEGHYRKIQNGECRNIEKAKEYFENDIKTILQYYTTLNTEQFGELIQSTFKLKEAEQKAQQAAIETHPSTETRYITSSSSGQSQQMVVVRELSPSPVSSSALVPTNTSVSQQLASYNPNTYKRYENSINEARQGMIGLQSKLLYLRNLGVIYKMNDDAFQELLITDKEDQQALYQSVSFNPLEDKNFESYIARFLSEHNTGYLVYWFREVLLLTPKNIIENRRATSKALDSFDYKSFWHLLAEQHDSHHILGKMMTEINTANQRDVAAIRATAQRSISSYSQSWTFSNIFNPDVLYMNMNPIAYAFHKANPRFAKLLLSEMVNAYNAFESKEKVHQCFDNILATVSHNNIDTIREAKLFRDSLLNAIIAEQKKKQTLLQSATSFIGERFSSRLPDKTDMQILSALCIHLAQNKPIPKEKDEIKKLIASLSKSNSALMSVDNIPLNDIDNVVDKIYAYLHANTTLATFTQSLEDDSEIKKVASDISYNNEKLTDTEQKFIIALLENNTTEVLALITNTPSLVTLTLNTSEGVINPLYICARLGYPALAAHLYAYATPVDTCGPDPYDQNKKISAFMVAAQYNQLDVIDAILAQRATANKKYWGNLNLAAGVAGYKRTVSDSQDQTCMHYLAQIGDPDRIIRWLNTEYDTRRVGQTYSFDSLCNTTDKQGNTPLHLLVQHGHLPCLVALNVWAKAQEAVRIKRFHGFENGIADLFNSNKFNALAHPNQDGLRPIEIAIQNNDPLTFEFLFSVMMKSKLLQKTEYTVARALTNSSDKINYSRILINFLDSEQEHHQKTNYNDYPTYIQNIESCLFIGLFTKDLPLVENSIEQLKALKTASAAWWSSKSDVNTMILNTFLRSLMNASDPTIEAVLIKEISTYLDGNPILLSCLTSLHKSTVNTADASRFSYLVDKLANAELIEDKTIAAQKLPRSPSRILDLSDSRSESSDNEDLDFTHVDDTRSRPSGVSSDSDETAASLSPSSSSDESPTQKRRVSPLMHRKYSSFDQASLEKTYMSLYENANALYANLNSAVDTVVWDSENARDLGVAFLKDLATLLNQIDRDLSARNLTNLDSLQTNFNRLKSNPPKEFAKIIRNPKAPPSVRLG